MRDKFFAFLESPDRESYWAVRSLLIASPKYDPYSDDLDGIEECIENGDHEAARERFSASMPNLLLSPRAHLAMAYLHRVTGDERGADSEVYIAQACCRGIVSTGDGSRSAPYFVVRTSDEYDVLQFLGLQNRMQSLVNEGTQHFDNFDCGGTQLWFDITDAYEKLQASLSRIRL